MPIKLKRFIVYYATGQAHRLNVSFDTLSEAISEMVKIQKIDNNKKPINDHVCILDRHTGMNYDYIDLVGIKIENKHETFEYNSKTKRYDFKSNNTSRNDIELDEKGNPKIFYTKKDRGNPYSSKEAEVDYIELSKIKAMRPDGTIDPMEYGRILEDLIMSGYRGF